jgi:hypothetical protein
MDYHFERRLRFKATPEESLYPCAIVEVDGDGEAVGSDQIPFGWSTYFTATELVLSDAVEIVTQREAENFEPQLNPEAVTHRRRITAKLRPGDARIEDRSSPIYRMFGSDRTITDFQLDIRMLTDPTDQERCEAWGSPSCTTEVDFRNVTEVDVVVFHLWLKPESFARYVARIATTTVDRVVLRVKGVDGFYSEWSPGVSTQLIKVLTGDGETHLVETPGGERYDLPRLGHIGQAELYIDAVRRLGAEPHSPDRRLLADRMADLEPLPKSGAQRGSGFRAVRIAVLIAVVLLIVLLARSLWH